MVFLDRPWDPEHFGTKHVGWYFKKISSEFFWKKSPFAFMARNGHWFFGHNSAQWSRIDILSRAMASSRWDASIDTKFEGPPPLWVPRRPARTWGRAKFGQAKLWCRRKCIYRFDSVCFSTLKVECYDLAISGPVGALESGGSWGSRKSMLVYLLHFLIYIKMGKFQSFYFSKFFSQNIFLHPC